jgi:thiol-disulfide isomerase/thioredoxin
VNAPAFGRRRSLCALLALVFGARVDARPVPGAVDGPLPAVTVADLGGRVSTTDQWRGRVVVLNVWATWCAPCRREMPSLDALNRSLDPSRFVVAGVSVDDDPIAVREYLVQHRLGFPNYIAAKRSAVLAALGLRGIPATFVVAADGTILQRHSGPRDWNTGDVRASLEAAWAGGRRGAAASRPDASAAGGGRNGRT